MRVIEAELGTELRALDPLRHVGFVLIDGMHGAEEAVNEALGNSAPLLDVVGGSAGDDLAFESTWVSVGDKVSHNGAALVVCETTGAFTVLKTCTFSSTGKKPRVTSAVAESRLVREFDGRPATEAYAEAVPAPSGIGQPNAKDLIALGRSGQLNPEFVSMALRYPAAGRDSDIAERTDLQVRRLERRLLPRRRQEPPRASAPRTYDASEQAADARPTF